MIVFALKSLSLPKTEITLFEKLEISKLLHRTWFCGYAGFSHAIDLTALEESVNESITYASKCSPLENTDDSEIDCEWLLKPDETEAQKALTWVGYDTAHYNDPIRQSKDQAIKRFRLFQAQIADFELSRQNDVEY